MSAAAASSLRDARSLLGAAWRSGRGPCVRALGLTFVLGLQETAGIALLVPLLGVAGLATGDGALGRIGDGTNAALRGVGLPASLPVLLAVFVALAVAGALLERARTVAAAGLGAAAALDLRRRLYAALSRSSWPWFSRLRSSAAVHALGDEAERAGSAAQALVAVAAQGTLALVAAAAALAVSPGPAALAAAAGLAALLCALRIRGARARGAAVSGAERALAAVLDDGLREARTDRAHGQAGAGAARFAEAAGTAAAARLSAFRHLAGSRALSAAGAAAVLALFVYLSVAVFGVPPAALLLSLFLLNRLLHRSLALVQQAEYAAADLPGFVTVDRMLRAATAAEEPAGRPGVPVPLRRGIRLEGVSFSYGGPGSAPAIRDADLEIPAGSLVSISGPPGSGGTTLADLVAGVLVPDRGRILVDGVPLDRDRRASWGASVGYVAEDALLLHGTVRSNLLRGRPGAEDDDLRRALARAGAEPFVRALTGGLDGDVGEGGRALPGRERVRIAIARALLREPALLVLDGVAGRLGRGECDRLLDALEDLRGRTTVLLVGPGGDEPPRADLTVRLRGGRLLLDGALAERGGERAA
jgi:ATP-binding cassette subfamily C protein